MRLFDYEQAPVRLLTPEIVQLIASIHEHKGRQELFLEANVVSALSLARIPAAVLSIFKSPRLFRLHHIL